MSSFDTENLLIKFFEEMYNHTINECGRCMAPYTCCARMYCDIAKEYAKGEYDIDLSADYISDQRIPFLHIKEGKLGCVVPAHLRPLCTLHTCSIHLMASSGNEEWDKRYWRLRKAIDYLAFRRERNRIKEEGQQLYQELILSIKNERIEEWS